LPLLLRLIPSAAGYLPLADLLLVHDVAAADLDQAQHRHQ